MSVLFYLEGNYLNVFNLMFADIALIVIMSIIAGIRIDHT